MHVLIHNNFASVLHSVILCVIKSPSLSFLSSLSHSIFLMDQHDLHEVRVEFDLLVASMHAQLDVHSNQMFDLLVAKINKRTSPAIEPPQSHIQPESGSPIVGDVSTPNPNHAHTNQSQPVIGQQPELLASQSDDAELGQFSNPATAPGMTTGQ